MTTIELPGHINDHGQLELDQATNLPPGEVRVIIETVDAGLEDDYEAKWAESFAKSHDVLERLSQEAHEEYLAGLTEEFDPDKDEA